MITPHRGTTTADKTKRDRSAKQPVRLVRSRNEYRLGVLSTVHHGGFVARAPWGSNAPSPESPDRRRPAVRFRSCRSANGVSTLRHPASQDTDTRVSKSMGVFQSSGVHPLSRISVVQEKTFVRLGTRRSLVHRYPETEQNTSLGSTLQRTKRSID